MKFHVFLEIVFSTKNIGFSVSTTPLQRIQWFLEVGVDLESTQNRPKLLKTVMKRWNAFKNDMQETHEQIWISWNLANKPTFKNHFP